MFGASELLFLDSLETPIQEGSLGAGISNVFLPI